MGGLATVVLQITLDGGPKPESVSARQTQGPAEGRQASGAGLHLARPVPRWGTAAASLLPGLAALGSTVTLTCRFLLSAHRDATSA